MHGRAWRAAIPGAVVLALVLVGVGCAGGAPAPTTAPTPRSSALGEGEALELVEATYGAYLAVSDQIAREGGAEPDRVRPFLSEDAFAQEQAAFEYLLAESLRLDGATTFDSTSVRSVSDNTIDVYLCLDLSGARLIGPDETDRTPVDRINRQPFEVSVRIDVPSPIIERNALWTGDNFC